MSTLEFFSPRKAVRVALTAVLAAGAALAAGSADAAVVAAQAVVTPTAHAGACPFMFTFTGKIVSNGPGVVKYKWIRSDGAIAPVQTLVFRERGAQLVKDTWTIGRTYQGWEAVQVLAPNALQSNPAKFDLVCRASPLVP